MITQLIASIIVGIIFSALAFIYFKHRYADKKSLWILVSIVMIVLSTGVDYLHAFYGSSDWIEAFEYLTMVAICIPAAFIDFKEQLIPNPIVLAGFICRIILYLIRLFVDTTVLLEVVKTDLIAFAITFVFCLLGRLLIKNGIGMGDVKLLLVLALLGGFDRLFSLLFFAMVIAFFWGLFELIIRRKGKNAVIPFGPPIAIGTVVSVAMYALI